MAEIFVSPDGDNSDGATWAKAYTATQTGLNNVPAGGSHIVIVAGNSNYNETMTVPNNPGINGGLNTLLFDTEGTYEDGGSNTSGRAAGRATFCKFDAQNEVDENYAILTAAGAGWNYWDIKGLTGYSLVRNVIDITGADLDYFGLIDSEIIRFQGDSIGIALRISIEHAGGLLNIVRSAIINHGTGNVAANFGALSILGSASSQSGTNVNIHDSFIMGPSIHRSAPVITSNVSLKYDCKRSTFFNHCYDNTQQASIFGTNSITDAEDCFVMTRGYWGYLHTDGSYTNNFYQAFESVLGFPGSGWTKIIDDEFKLLPAVPFMAKQTIGSGGPVSGTDIRGNSRNGSVGCEEFISGQSLKYPIVGTGIQGIDPAGVGGGILRHPGMDGGIK